MSVHPRAGTPARHDNHAVGYTWFVRGPAGARDGARQLFDSVLGDGS